MDAAHWARHSRPGGIPGSQARGVNLLLSGAMPVPQQLAFASGVGDEIHAVVPQGTFTPRAPKSA
jgi:hypothetical protein